MLTVVLTVHNSRNMESIQVSNNKWMDDENATYTHNTEWFRAFQGEDALLLFTVWIKLKNIAQMKKDRHKKTSTA